MIGEGIETPCFAGGQSVFPLSLSLSLPPCPHRGLPRRLRLRIGRRVAEFLQDPARAFRLSVDEQRRRVAERRTAKVIRDLVSLHAIEERGDLNQPGANGNEPDVDHGATGR